MPLKLIDATQRDRSQRIRQPGLLKHELTKSEINISELWKIGMIGVTAIEFLFSEFRDRDRKFGRMALFVYNDNVVNMLLLFIGSEWLGDRILNLPKYVFWLSDH